MDQPDVQPTPQPAPHVATHITVQPVVQSGGSGSTGNVIAALASFFIPGLGQLLQGRWVAAILFFLAWIVLWCCCCLGFIPQIWATLDAAVWRPKN